MPNNFYADVSGLSGHPFIICRSVQENLVDIDKRQLHILLFRNLGTMKYDC